MRKSKQAVKAGLSVMNGLHTRMNADPEIAENIRPGQWVWDMRREPRGLTVGSAKAMGLACDRVLTVGTDMAVGKMSTSIELNRACQKKGLRSKLIATGQTGLMLGEDGIPARRHPRRLCLRRGGTMPNEIWRKSRCSLGRRPRVFFQSSFHGNLATAQRDSAHAFVLVHKATLTHIMNSAILRFRLCRKWWNCMRRSPLPPVPSHLQKSLALRSIRLDSMKKRLEARSQSLPMKRICPVPTW